METKSEIKICPITRTLLRYSFIWPSQKHELQPKISYYSIIATFFLITTIWWVSVVVHLTLMLKNKVDVDLTEEIVLITAFVGVYLMVFSFVRNQHKVALLMRDLSYYEHFGEPPGLVEREAKMNWFVKIGFFYDSMTIIFYNLMKLAQKAECEKGATEYESCGLLTPVWTPFDISGGFAFYVVYIYVFVCCFQIMKLPFLTFFTSLELVHHIILRIDHLKQMIIECFEDENTKPEERRRRLGRCISYHLEIISFADRLNECFSISMFFHLILTGGICACIENQIVKRINFIGGILHFLGWILALFLACIGGQHLLDASDSIPEAIVTSKWYHADVKLRKDLWFMLSRAQRDFHLTAGPFGVVSYALFVSVLKMSYSILCVLTS